MMNTRVSSAKLISNIDQTLSLSCTGLPCSSRGGAAFFAPGGGAVELFLLLVLTFFHRALEAFHRAAEVTADIAQFLGAEQQHDDGENDQQLPRD